MRVNRALEKLQVLLKHRGVTLSATALGAMLTAEAATAGPVGMAATISGLALASSTMGTGTAITILNIMVNTKLKLALAALVVAGAATTLVLQHQNQTTLRQENEFLRQQISRSTAGKASRSKREDQLNKPASLPGDPANELLRLRGEVGMLRAQNTDLARLRQDNQKLQAKLAAQSDLTNQLSADDRFILKQTHAVDAMPPLLNALKSYAANHNGQYPSSLDQLVASGDLATTNLAGNLGLDDFQILDSEAVDQRGRKFILGIRVPIQKTGKTSVTVMGGIDDAGYPMTEVTELMNTDAE